MTKKPYRKTARVSRSARRQRPRGNPFEARYRQLQGDDPHPVDLIIDEIPQVRALDRKLIRLARRVQQQVRDPKGYVRYEDLRAEQRCMREQVFFDAGHAQGRIDGVVESLDSSVKLNRDARAFARRVQVARLSSRLSSERVVAVLMELARGLVLVGRDSNRSARRSS
jgi:hypothetical protein